MERFKYTIRIGYVSLMRQGGRGVDLWIKQKIDFYITI